MTSGTKTESQISRHGIADNLRKKGVALKCFCWENKIFNNYLADNSFVKIVLYKCKYLYNDSKLTFWITLAPLFQESFFNKIKKCASYF